MRHLLSILPHLPPFNPGRYLVLAAVGLASTVHGVDFARDVAPLFEAKCVGCHQPNILKGDFSLTSAAELTASGKVVAGDPDASRLYKVIRPKSDGSAPEMPAKGTPFNADEVETIRQWILEGAAWPEDLTLAEQSKADSSWWSLQAIADVSPPEVPEAPGPWQANPIDRFLYARMTQDNLAPAPRADRRTLIRRIYIDLLGLPPTLEAIRAFEADERPEAWEQLVDSLLASPQYGERWARHWLDVAHYADTHGFERDQRRDSAWRYRDYVIRALNDDKPYDQFIREQIAGDVLHPESQDAVIATGFLAAGPWDFVGQVETKSAQLRRAARADDLDDMVTTVMTSSMALTVNCARCHDHKLDPILQKDYYQLTAVFAGTTRGERSVAPIHDAVQLRLAALEKELAGLKAASIDLVDVVAGGDGSGSGNAYPAGIDLKTGTIVEGMITYVDKAATNQYQAVADSPFVDGVFIPDGRDGVAVPITSTDITLDELPATSGKSWDHILNGPVSSQDGTEVGGIDYGKKPHRVLGFHANKGITFDLDALREARDGTAFRFSTVVAYGGGQDTTKADFFLYVDGQLRAAREGFRKKDEGHAVTFDIAEGERFLTFIATDGGDGIGHDQVFFGDPQLEIRDASVTTLSAEDQERKSQLEVERDKLRRLYPPDETPDRVYATLATDPPSAHILLRGSPETPGEVVMPGALSCFEDLPAVFGDESLDEGERRVALAQWITHPDNPLTARVWANRLWHHHFGTGIVDTPSDFGFGGGRPSHPELLDWLATELQRQGWSTKALHRLMLTSAAYQQESRLSESYDLANQADPRRVDGDNRLLWRMNPRRLGAESLRDSVLQVTGNLNPEMFGPGYRDFDYVEEYAPQYTYITADAPELWRRSIYRFVVRTTPQPFMTTLDCPNPAVLTPARMTTTTALQSLSLLNNDFMLKQAGYFAARVKAEAGDDTSAQVTKAFSLALGRDATQEERERCAPLIDQLGLPALCRVLLNANEFVHID